MTTLKGEEKSLAKVFCSDYEFHIPPYQRPYCWTIEQVDELFEDLWTFWKYEPDEERYFLGSIVLVKGDSPKSDVVDGQQRLTTLSMLLAIINYNLKQTEWKNAFHPYLTEPGNVAEKLEAKPRLFLRERDKHFFRQYVQEPAGMDSLANLDPKRLKDSQYYITSNLQHFQKRLNDVSPDNALQFGQFIINNCYLVLVSTDSFNSAYRIFSVLNDRGIELEPSDILKARLIGEIPEYERNTYNQEWEELEEQLGRSEFNALLAHTRMIFQKEKARKSMVDEIQIHIVDRMGDHRRLIDDYLLPYGQHYNVIANTAYESAEGAEPVNRLLRWLQRTNNVDWTPVAIVLLSKYEGDAAKLQEHLKLLERLAGSMFVRGVYVTPRIERYGQVLRALEGEEDLRAEDSPLQLTRAEIDQTVDILNGPIYQYSARLRSFVMLRLDSFLADVGASYDHKLTTIEHVLPRNPARESEWMFDWNEDERDYWVDRLGNLVLLSRKKNTEASNYDFATKKRRYFRTASGVSLYASATKVLEVEKWTPDVVEQRQEELLNAFRKEWSLR